jgi:hypothetical protein
LLKVFLLLVFHLSLVVLALLGALLPPLGLLALLLILGALVQSAH